MQRLCLRSRPVQILSPIIGHGFHVSVSKFSLSTWASLSLVLALAAAWVSFALPRLDQSANDFTSQLGRAFLDPLPAGALLLLMADTATNSVCQTVLFDYERAVRVMLCRCDSCRPLKDIVPMCLYSIRT